MIAILMLSAKLVTPGLPLKSFLNKDYDVIIFACDITNKMLSREPNYILDMVM